MCSFSHIPKPNLFLSFTASIAPGLFQNLKAPEAQDIMQDISVNHHSTILGD